jgi:hypothetical protein
VEGLSVEEMTGVANAAVISSVRERLKQLFDGLRDEQFQSEGLRFSDSSPRTLLDRLEREGFSDEHGTSLNIAAVLATKSYRIPPVHVYWNGNVVGSITAASNALRAPGFPCSSRLELGGCKLTAHFVAADSCSSVVFEGPAIGPFRAERNKPFNH